MLRLIPVLFAILAILGANNAQAQSQSFKDLVGNIKVGEVKSTNNLQVPYIFWGGDYGTFYANGGLTTSSGTIFDDLGLDINLKAGDDFVQQVRDYMSGKSPFLRGTFGMVSMASEVIDQDPRTKGVVLFQMTWSAGDHIVGRSSTKNLSSLKGTTGVLQRGGPHVGLVNDMLEAVQLTWDDVNIIWVDEITGKNGPAEKFRNDKNIDWCAVVTPDMFGLTGGFESVGNGVEGTVRGAKIVLSTAELSKSIADVYVVRQDFLQDNYELCSKFTAGYLKSVEEIIEHRKEWESRGSERYENLLKMAQGIYGKDSLPTLEEDAHGLLADCTFVGHPGNVAFFNDTNNPTGFGPFVSNRMNMAISLGIIDNGRLSSSSLDWSSNQFVGYLAKTDFVKTEKFNAEAVLSEIEALNSGALDSRTRLSFEIEFDANQQEFSIAQYSTDFDRVLENAAKFGNAVIVVRGHSDPTRTLLEAIRAGMDSGVITRSGSKGNYSYKVSGRSLDLENTKKIVELVTSGALDRSAQYDPRRYYTAAQTLSRQRAEEVVSTIVAYAQSKGLEIDPSQIQPQGIGISSPVVAKPSNAAEAAQNRRVEFRLVRVSAETMNESDFDF